MSDCKVKINVDICGESALDAVTKLVVDGMTVNKACKQVAEDFNTKNEGATVKVETLRKSYNRAQKVGTCPNNSTKKLGHVPTLEKELVPLDVPMINSTTECIVDTTKYVPIELYTEAQKRIKQLEEAVESMLPYVDKAMSFETVPDPAPEKSTLLPRQAIYDFIKQRGNTIQCHALKSDDLSNDKLYSIFVKVRDDYKTSTPPPAWDTSVTTATGIL